MLVGRSAADLTGYLDVSRQIDGELGGSENMLGLGPGWQGVGWGHTPDEGALARLTYSKVASVQHPKAHLTRPHHGGISQVCLAWA